MSRMLLAASGEAAKAGPIGLAVILLLCIACYFLFKSMSTHLRRVRDQFPDEEPAPRPGTQRPGAARPLSRAEFERSRVTKAEVVPPVRDRPALDAAGDDAPSEDA